MIKLELTEEEAQIILNALIKEPYSIVFELINSIQEQATEQMKNEN